MTRWPFPTRRCWMSPPWHPAAVVLVFVLAVAAAESQAQETVKPVAYSGMCDASAAVPLSSTLFLTADDEGNTLRVYDVDRPGEPVDAFPWDEPLGIALLEDKHPEVDIEGAAMLGGRIYLIASHGRNKDGKWRPNRHRFFALSARVADGRVSLQPIGTPCETLIRALIDDERYDELELPAAVAYGVKKVEKLAPKRKGLNIEGLCAAADGRTLLIAFRNPRPDDKALLVPLLNPSAVITDQARPRFGNPILLKLEARIDGQMAALGIRSIEFSPRHRGYLIVAGPADSHRQFALYHWSGNPAEAPRLLPQATVTVNRLEGFTPEALLVWPDRDPIQLLSDDGSRRVKVGSPAECKSGEYDNGYCEAKHLLDARRRTFRSVWVEAR